MNNVIECIKLAKNFTEGTNTVHVLQEVDLTVQPGELIAIVGVSGSGKSTLLQLLGGLDKPTSGKVFIHGRDVTLLSESQKCELRNRYLGFVYQFHHLLPEFTAEENVAMPLLIRDTSPEIAASKAASMLDAVGLKSRLQHKIGELSGGERQRVAIARALITDPLCVLADEPTGNLDPGNANKVFQLFLSLQKTLQTSVIIVTHDIQIAKQADRIFMLENGRLVEHSPL